MPILLVSAKAYRTAIWGAHLYILDWLLCWFQSSGMRLRSLSMSNWADLVSLQSSLQWKSKCTLQHKVPDVRCQGWCPWHPLWCWLLQFLHSLPVKLSVQAILPPQTYTHPEQLWISPWTHGLKILLPDIATHKAKDWLQNTLQLFQISPQIPCEKMQHTLTIKHYTILVDSNNKNNKKNCGILLQTIFLCISYLMFHYEGLGFI